jgi:hypothetical protein
MKRLFHLYQYFGPLVLTPLAALLWLRHYDGNLHMVALALGVPILHAYVVPAIGTNVLGMWAFNTRLRLGRFRPHHGFVFGSATAMLTLPLMGTPGGGSPAATALVVGSVLLAVNWVYDALALKHGVLEVYNQPWAEGAGPWSVAGDYVIWFFGVFGLIYGAGLRLAERHLLIDPTAPKTLVAAGLLAAATMLVPTALYVGASWLRHGHSGCRPFVRHAEDVSTP